MMIEHPAVPEDHQLVKLYEFQRIESIKRQNITGGLRLVLMEFDENHWVDGI